MATSPSPLLLVLPALGISPLFLHTESTNYSKPRPSLVPTGSHSLHIGAPEYWITGTQHSPLLSYPSSTLTLQTEPLHF